MTRNGKIARRPQFIREQINRRLQNGEEGKQIAEWLNSLPEVAALMTAEFDGQPIHEPNLSHWRLGGYRDWEEQQVALEAARRYKASSFAGSAVDWTADKTARRAWKRGPAGRFVHGSTGVWPCRSGLEPAGIVEVVQRNCCQDSSDWVKWRTWPRRTTNPS